jgi:rhamnosyltransferase
LISVIIPVKNGSLTLARCLEGIKNQQCTLPIEVLVIDSDSTDSSVEIARKFGAKLISINSSDFNHGMTRNFGAQQSNGDFLFFTVQDAFFTDNKLFQTMANWFIDEKVMSVSGHQAVPHENDKNPMLWFRRYSDPIPEIRECNYNQPNPRFSWDNVISMYRKSALVQLPFEKTDTGEDWIWAHEALKKGWRLVYDPSIIAWHYHHRNFIYIFKSEFLVMYTFFKRLALNPTWPSFFDRSLKMIFHILKNNKLPIGSKFKWIRYNLIANFADWFTVLTFKVLKGLGNITLLDYVHRILYRSIPQGLQNIQSK